MNTIETVILSESVTTIFGLFVIVFTGAPSNKTVVGSSGNIVPRPVSQPAHGHEATDGSRPSRHGVQQDERRKL